MILESFLILKLYGPRALLLPFVEVALPANLFTDILSWQAAPIYLQHVFTKLISATQSHTFSSPRQATNFWDMRLFISKAEKGWIQKEFAASLCSLVLWQIWTHSSLILGNSKAEEKQIAPKKKKKCYLRPLIQILLKPLKMQTLPLLGAASASLYWNGAIKMLLQWYFSPLVIKKT